MDRRSHPTRRRRRLPEAVEKTIGGFELSSAIPAGRQVVQTYGDGRFRVSGSVYAGSVVVLPERTEIWNVARASDVSLASLAPILESDTAVDVLFIGCGTEFVEEPAGLREALKARGIVLEWMDTGAACRTLNVLVMDGRPAAAALIAVP